MNNGTVCLISGNPVVVLRRQLMSAAGADNNKGLMAWLSRVGFNVDGFDPERYDSLLRAETFVQDLIYQGSYKTFQLN